MNELQKEHQNKTLRIANDIINYGRIHPNRINPFMAQSLPAQLTQMGQDLATFSRDKNTDDPLIAAYITGQQTALIRLISLLDPTYSELSIMPLNSPTFRMFLLARSNGEHFCITNRFDHYLSTKGQWVSPQDEHHDHYYFSNLHHALNLFHSSKINLPNPLNTHPDFLFKISLYRVTLYTFSQETTRVIACNHCQAVLKPSSQWYMWMGHDSLCDQCGINAVQEQSKEDAIQGPQWHKIELSACYSDAQIKAITDKNLYLEMSTYKWVGAIKTISIPAGQKELSERLPHIKE